MKRALLGLLMVTGCGGLEYEPSPLAAMDVAGVWSDVFRMENPPALFPTDEPMHNHATTTAYITASVDVEEMAHALTHVWIRREALKLSPQEALDSAESLKGDPTHLQPVWAATQLGDDVLERHAATWLRANPTR